MDAAYQLLDEELTTKRKEETSWKLRLIYVLSVLGFVIVGFRWFCGHWPGMSSPPHDPNILKILCLGDSLTAGVVNFGEQPDHPYTTVFSQVLQKSLPGKGVVVIQEGLSGDFVSSIGQYMTRLTKRFQESASQPYDWVVILGGTNDLGRTNLSGPDIWAALQRLYNKAFTQGQVLAMTVPEMAPERVIGLPEDQRSRRDEVNRLMEAHTEEGFYVFDLHGAIPYTSLNAEQRRQLWSDGVHFSAKGYDLMGRFAAERLLEVL